MTNAGSGEICMRALVSLVLCVSCLLVIPAEPIAADASSSTRYVIADHAAVAAFDRIPEYYIGEIKKMLLSFPGESHGLGPLYGLEDIELEDPSFAVEVKWWTSSEGPEDPTDQHLRVQREFWDGGDWDGDGDYWEYNTGEEETWTSQEAIDATNAHFAHARSLGKPYDAFVWGWCRDMTEGSSPGGDEDPEYGVHWAGRTYVFDGTDQGRWGLDEGDTALTGNSLSVQSYIDVWGGYAAANPDIVFIYSTGTVDPGPQGDQHIGEWGYQRFLKNEYLRNWVRNNGGYLFDYADILNHNSAGEPFFTAWDGHLYRTIHPDNIGNYTGSEGTTAHIGQEGTLMLGKALWVLLAKAKGWEEPSRVPALSSLGKLALVAALLASVALWRRATAAAGW
jgi:hypothetical protein